MSDPKIGRPPLATGQGKTSVIVLRLTSRQKAALVRRAQAKRLTLSAWMLAELGV